jgi:uncharacterized protein (TIGR00730 family)
MRICVFCGSSPGHDSQYVAAAQQLGRRLIDRGIGLVYGGASVGLMGALANEVLDNGGDVIGVMPQGLVDFEVAHKRLGDLRIVGSMHERKALMADLSDAFIALPGGIGTLEETFEMLTWAQLGFQPKPVALLDTDSFYSKLTSFLDHVVDEGFLRPEHRSMLMCETDPDRLLDRIEAYTPPVLEKWMDRDQT